MDRRVYFRAVILIVTTLSQSKPQEYSKNTLSEMLEADRKTINRWLAYFREIFPKSSLWQTIRGFIHPDVANQTLPQSLVEHYLENIESSQDAILNCLVLLTTGKMMEQ